MRMRILCIGESKALYLKEGEADFVGRLKHYTPFTLEMIRAVRHSKSESGDQIQKEESELLLKKIESDSTVVALDPNGKSFTSESFAAKISAWQNQGKREILFIIGGPLGLHPSLLSRADLILSLSKMTFTHDMARLILLEQLYRAYTILKGEKYHK